MPILDFEILWRPAVMVSDAAPAQNGGRMSFVQIVSGVKNNLFPDVSQSERTAGSVKWRKAFIHVASAQNVPLQNARVFLDQATPAGDFVVFHPGTQTDTQDQIGGRPYGVGTLYEAGTANASQIKVVGENHSAYAGLQPFRAGDLIRVSNRLVGGTTGNEEFVQIASVTAASGYFLIDLAAPLQNAYATADTVVSSVLMAASIGSSIEHAQTTSVNGSFSASGASTSNKGSVEDIWTITFNGATTFSVSGMATGALATPGSTLATYAPVNPATGAPYFSLDPSCWAGTFAPGELVQIATHPAALPVWYRREVPAGTASTTNDYASLTIYGESA